jgi:hypothetical protein
MTKRQYRLQTGVTQVDSERKREGKRDRERETERKSGEKDIETVERYSIQNLWMYRERKIDV